MPLEVSFCELNGINITQFTHKIKEEQTPDMGTIPRLGDEHREFAEDEPGIRRITWEGYISNSETYLKLRKELFGSAERTLRLSPDRKMILRSLHFEKVMDIREPEKNNKMVITMLAADTYEYGIAVQSEQAAISASPATIEVHNTGHAPTTPDWTITATGTIVNPVIDNGTDEMEWSGTLAPGDVLVIKKDGSTTVNGAVSNPVNDMPLKAGPGKTIFTYRDSTTSSHNCTLNVEWSDAYY
jgi:hypothetical protein